MAKTDPDSVVTVESWEVQFAAARKEIMELRLENQKLEKVITSLAQPMVVSSSDSDDGEDPPRKRQRGKGALVVALPQGEAQEKIEKLIRENAKLAAEVSTVLEASSQKSSGSGVASLYQRTKQLEKQVGELESQLAEQECAHTTALKSLASKHEKEMRMLKGDLQRVSEELEKATVELSSVREHSDTQAHECNKRVAVAEKEVDVLAAENMHLRKISQQILDNAKLARIQIDDTQWGDQFQVSINN